MKKILEVKFGSHLYGTDTENSDLDLKGIFIPTKEELLSGSHPRTIQNKRNKLVGERNTKDDVDVEMFSLDRFVQLLCEGQTVALDMIFAPHSNFTEEGEIAYKSYGNLIWDELVNNKEELLSRNVSSFVGYAKKQAAKFGVKGSRIAAVREVLRLLKTLPQTSKLIAHEDEINTLIEANKKFVSLEKTPLIEIVEIPSHKDGPLQKFLSCCGRKSQLTSKVQDAVTIYQRVFDEYGARALQAETNQGVDFKALSHAVRVNSEAVELLKTGKITLPLPNRALVLDIKLGKLPYGEVATMIEQGLADLEAARAVSNLRPEPNKAWADEFVARIYSEICGEWPLRPTMSEGAILAVKSSLAPSGALHRLKPVISFMKRAKWKLKVFFNITPTSRKSSRTKKHKTI